MGVVLPAGARAACRSERACSKVRQAARGVQESAAGGATPGLGRSPNLLFRENFGRVGRPDVAQGAASFAKG